MIVVKDDRRRVRYFFQDLMIEGAFFEVSEKEFFAVVNLQKYPYERCYDPNNINRLNFYLYGELIGYREYFLLNN